VPTILDKDAATLMQPLLLVWILLIGFMFYFLMIKPQKKARAQQSDMLSHLKVGSEVRTTAQVLGTVVELGEDYAVIETTPGTLIKFAKPAIVGIILSDEDAAGTSSDEADDSAAAGETGEPRDTDEAAAKAEAAPAADAAPVQDAAPTTTAAASKTDAESKTETAAESKTDAESVSKS
jgi:preprotein translocase subunit YajC